MKHELQPAFWELAAPALLRPSPLQLQQPLHPMLSCAAAPPPVPSAPAAAVSIAASE